MIYFKIRIFKLLDFGKVFYHSLFCIVLLLGSFLLPKTGYALIIDPAEQLEKQERQEDIQRELLSTREQPNELPQDINLRFQPFRGCLSITKINIVGDKLLRDLLLKKYNALVTPHLHHCITAAELNDLIIKLNAVLLANGYVTARLNIEKYAQKTQELTIRIQAGIIEQFQTTAINRHVIFAGLVGKNLCLNDLDRRLQQLNRLPSQASVVTLWPGNNVGGTIVKVDTKQIDRPYRFYLSGDNTGNKYTGSNVLKGHFSYDNLLHINDQLNLSGSKSGLGSERSEAITWREEMPFNLYNFTYSGDYSYTKYNLNSEVVGNLELITKSFKHKINVARNIYNDISHDVSLHTALWRYTPQRKLASSTLAKQNLSVVEIGVNYSYNQPNFTLINQFRYSQGINLFGATRDASDLTRRDSHAQFSCYNLTIDYLWKVAEAMHLNGNIQMQYAHQGLPGIMQLVTLDAISGVRGVMANGLTLDEGVILRHDFAFPYVFSKIGKKINLKKTAIVPFLHGDIGWAQDKDSAYASKKYLSIGGGIKLNVVNFSAKGTISKLINKPDRIKNEGWVVLFEFSQKIF